MTTRTEMMVALMLPPAHLQFRPPETLHGQLCVCGRGEHVWANLYGPAEALRAASISIALDSPLGSHSVALAGPLFMTLWRDDVGIIPWYLQTVQQLLTPRMTLVQLDYDAHPVRVVCDRAEQRLNLLIRLSDD